MKCHRCTSATSSTAPQCCYCTLATTCICRVWRPNQSHHRAVSPSNTAAARDVHRLNIQQFSVQLHVASDTTIFVTVIKRVRRRDSDAARSKCATDPRQAIPLYSRTPLLADAELLNIFQSCF